jgi:NAD(P)-dependent dehydrogenase (short-subunit alcohol dehydrogenase family)
VNQEVPNMPVAVITGGSRGFGRALAIGLATDGWTLVVDGRDEASLREVGDRLIDLSPHSKVIAGDVASAHHRATLIDSAMRCGSLDLLVNNASALGPSPLPSLEHYPLADLRRVFAPLALIQEALPQLRRSQGTVVALSSDAAAEPYEGWGGYGSSKAALDQLHQVLAAEEPELRVYQFDPGDMRTAMHQAAYPGEDISDRPDPESVVPTFRALLESGSPSGRYRADAWVVQP